MTTLQPRIGSSTWSRSASRSAAYRICARILFLASLAGAATASLAQTNCSELPPDTRVEPLGRFSNTRYTEEHAYGYDVLLWQAGDCLIGILQYSAGLSGDTPTGLIERVEYVPSTGGLSFGARLTTGLTAARENGELVSRPSRDYFTFRGTLDLAERTLAGTVEHGQGLAPTAAETDVETIALQAQDSSSTYPNAATFGGWQEQLAPILAARGPKW
jgi:hypothetical protein